MATAREFQEQLGITAGSTRIGAFLPYGHQEDFYRSRKHQIILGGGNKAGKTYCNVMKAALRSIPEKDKYGKNTGWLLDPYVRLRVPRGGVQGSFSCWSQAVQKRTIQRDFDRIFGGKGIDGKPFLTSTFKDKGCYHTAETECASIYFVWQQAYSESYTGANLDWAAMDEPHDREIYYEFISRLTEREGYAWISLTPIVNTNDPDAARKARFIKWMDDEIVSVWDRDHDLLPEVDIIYVDIDENPHVNTQFALDMWASMTEQERLIRKTGKFLWFVGASLFDADELRGLGDYLRDNPEVSNPEHGVLHFDPDETDEEWKITFSKSRPEFPHDPKDGWIWKIWEHPVQDQLSIAPEYCIGVDPSGSGVDRTAAYVCRVDTGEMVAALHGYLDEIELARQLWLAGNYYCSRFGYADEGPIGKKPAKLAVETTGGIGNTTLSYLMTGHEGLQIPKYGMENLYRQPKDEDVIKGRHLRGKKVGWYTSPRTRGHLLTSMRRALSDSYAAIQEDRMPVIRDRGWIIEAETFIFTSQNKYEARSGHFDDRLFGKAICDMVIEQERKRSGFYLPERKHEPPKELWYFVDDGEPVFNMFEAKRRAGQTKRKSLWY